jgi:hypothetical protein
MMNALVMEYARRAGVQKLVGIGTVCAYPEATLFLLLLEWTIPRVAP